uniref:Putative signal recognition particle 19 kDa protein n=1 Tax=Tabanus bromius TaxID=304241 RepID=A0A0K8TTI0_TABBR
MAASMPVKTNFHPSKTHSDLERWVCVYPAYINSKKTRQEGRKLAKQHCVENPTYMEIRDVLSVTNLHIAIENKQYPREKSKELLYRGRIRVQIKNDDGTPVNPEFPTRESVFLHLGHKIPLLKTRQNKGSEPAQQQQSQSGGGQSGHKKGGKGKRRQ